MQDLLFPEFFIYPGIFMFSLPFTKSKCHPRKPLGRFLFLIIFLIFSPLAFSGNLQLAWDASTSANTGGYKIYYGVSSGNYTSSVDAGNVTAYQITGLQNGTKYFFAVKSYDNTKTAESTFSNEINAIVPTPITVTADFTASATSGDPGMVVSFTPVTTGTISQWSWNFGDGATSTAQNPTHTYNLAGSYTVSLTVTGADGTASKSVPNFITVAAAAALPPVADFTVNATTGTAPASFTFTDASTGDITGRQWNFGDGTTSTALNPSHTYSAAGTYSVSLTVNGPGGETTKAKAGLITLSAPAIVPNGLVAAYNFDSVTDSLVVDGSGNGNTGIVKGPTLTAGRYGNGLKFDGINDLVSVPSNTALALTKNFSIEAWVKPAAISRSSIIFKEKVGGSVYSLYAYEDSDLAAASFYDGTGDNVVYTNSAIAINKWTYLAVTYDGVSLKMYRNGMPVSSIKATNAVKISNGLLQIGGNKVLGEYFNGLVDNVRIYNIALTQTQIQSDAKTPVANSPGTPPAGSTTLIVGNDKLENAVDSNLEGNAEAFLTTAQKTGTVTKLEVYLDATSTATELVAGIYADNAGHPGKLLAQGKLSTLQAGATNTVAIPPTSLTSSTSYWIAILGTKGQIKFRDRMGTGISPLETSAETTLLTLPNQWTSGTVYPLDGPVTAYGSGL